MRSTIAPWRPRTRDETVHPGAGAPDGGRAGPDDDGPPDDPPSQRIRLSAGWRSPTLVWLVVVASTAVALGGALGIVQLQQYAAQRSGLRVVLAEMETAAWQRNALEWQAIAERRVTPSVAREQHDAREAALAMSARLWQRDPDSAEALAVQSALARYNAAIDLEFNLLGDGQIGHATQVDDEKVDPAFDALAAELDDADRRYGALARQADLQAWLGTVLILAAEVMIIGVLVWRFQRVRARAFQQVAHQAAHDALTGLPNRTLLHERTADVLRHAGRNHTKAALLLIDLDRFKEVNDTLGHSSGDQLLVQVAHRMRAALRHGDTVARLGGDEFAVLLPEVATVQDVAAVATKLRAVFDTPFLLGGLEVTVDASVGAALYPEHGTNADDMLQFADIAMYVAKTGQTGFAVFDPGQEHDAPRRLNLASDLRHAIDHGQLLLHYQPKVDTHSRRVLGVEALVRWQHPKHGLIPPLDFIPLAESIGLITPLTHFVLDAALRQCQAWRQAGHELIVSVNVSTRRLLDPAFPDEVADLLARWRIPAGMLELEITESAIIADPVHALQVLEKLNAMGVQLSIDDFGTGYSSMAYLKILPVHELKVDRSFVSHMTTSARDAVIVRSTVELGRNLGLRVVAEGVEDSDTCQALDAAGCDAIQGYYISRPVTAEQLEEWLEQHQPAESR